MKRIYAALGGISIIGLAACRSASSSTPDPISASTLPR